MTDLRRLAGWLVSPLLAVLVYLLAGTLWLVYTVECWLDAWYRRHA